MVTVGREGASVKPSSLPRPPGVSPVMKRSTGLLLALVLLLPQAGPAAASAMPEAPNCPIYQPDDVWHSLVQGLPVLPQSDA